MEGKQKISKLAIASLVFGILGILNQTSAWIAIILAETFRYNNKKRESPLGGKAIAWWGFGLGALFALSRIAMVIIKHYAK
jgi:hypothetical protein